MTLEILRSDVLAGTRHGFFTRRGGASSGVFAGLNCGLGSSDQSDAVRINRARVAAAMGVESARLVTLHQVHSADVVALNAVPGTAPRADAAVTAVPGLALAILSADCQPVLFCDPDARVIGAAHAGWRGTLDGVLEATLHAMERQGASRRNIRVAIGPAISQRAYEVGPELLDAFTAEDAEAARYFAGGAGDRLQFDLPGYSLHRLREAGVRDAEWTRHCTYGDSARFFSYRRSCHDGHADYGRLISVIRL